MVHQEKSKADPCGLVLTFSFGSAGTRRGSGVERTSGGRPRPRKTERVVRARIESLMVHQQKPHPNKGEVFVFLSAFGICRGLFLFVRPCAFLSSLGDGFMPRKTLDMS